MPEPCSCCGIQRILSLSGVLVTPDNVQERPEAEDSDKLVRQPASQDYVPTQFRGLELGQEAPEPTTTPGSSALTEASGIGEQEVGVGPPPDGTGEEGGGPCHRLEREDTFRSHDDTRQRPGELRHAGQEQIPDSESATD